MATKETKITNNYMGEFLGNPEGRQFCGVPGSSADVQKLLESSSVAANATITRGALFHAAMQEDVNELAKNVMKDPPAT